MDWRQTLSELRSRLFPPLTKSSFLRHYVPTSGAISHTLFSIHIFAPQITSSIFPTYDLAVSNTILFNSHVGIGYYVFFRKHQIRLKMWDRIEFSVFASVLFNFGSLMFSVLFKALLPKRLNTAVSALIGASLSTFLLSRGIKYMNQIDARTVIPLNGLPKQNYIPSSVSQPRKVNGHLPAIAEHKPAVNGHLPAQPTLATLPEPTKQTTSLPEPTKQPAQFATPAIELRTSA